MVDTSAFAGKDLVTWLIGACTVLLAFIWKGQEKKLEALALAKADKVSVDAHKELVNAQLAALIERLNRDDIVERARNDKMDRLIELMQERTRR